MKIITIAIDGFSSTGKSTIAKQLAKKLAYSYVDSGAMYRAVTLYAMNNNFISESYLKKELLIKDLSKINLEFRFNKFVGFGEIYLNDKNVEHEIRTLEVSKLVSKVAEISEIRKKLVEQQQLMGKNKGVIMDGRDIGTVVFPKAELKVFMIASSVTRAQRRFEELQEKGQTVSFEEVLKNVEQRDYIDTHRDDSPLRKADDAIEIDNSYLTREEQFNAVLEMVEDVTKSL